MDEFIKAFGVWAQPQLLSLIVTVLIIIIFSIVVFFKVRKTKVNEAPKGVAYFAEAYVNLFDNNYESIMNGKLSKTRLYILTLGTFLLVGNFMVVFGLEPIATSYSVTLTLGLATWLGIYVVGILYQKFRFFLRYLKNPIDLIGQFAPLISISFRIYGNIIGGGTVVYLLYMLFGYLWKLAFKTEIEYYFFAPLITPFFHLYFDLFGACIQAYVFSILTAVYWVNEATNPGKKNENSSKSKVKKSKILQLKQSAY